MGVPPPNFSWVIPGRLAGLALPRLPAHYQFLLAQGVRHLVSLTERGPPHGDSCPGLTLHRLRIPDFCPPDPEQIDRFVQIVDEANARGEVSGRSNRRKGPGRGQRGHPELGELEEQSWGHRAGRETGKTGAWRLRVKLKRETQGRAGRWAGGGGPSPVNPLEERKSRLQLGAGEEKGWADVGPGEAEIRGY